MKRPSWLGAPAPALQLMLGEMATILLNGQKVVPAAAQKLGYAFKHPSLRETLQDCLK
jgi:NAD dependent epimerase/dehydratase family enzyme